MSETIEQFLKRYPRPKSAYPEDYTRVLLVCTCVYGDGPHWSWGFWYFDETDGGLMNYETLAEPEPGRGKK